MCVGVPAKILVCDEISATVELTGTTREISMMTLENAEEAKPGDWVLVHAGFALALIDPEEAEETLRQMIELSEHNY